MKTMMKHHIYNSYHIMSIAHNETIKSHTNTMKVPALEY